MKICITAALAKQPILSIIFLFSSITAGYGQSTYKYAPTGQLVDAGGHLLHIHVMGKGKPVVVFENRQR